MRKKAANLCRLQIAKRSIGKRDVSVLEVVAGTQVGVRIPGDVWHFWWLNCILSIVVELIQRKMLQKLSGKPKINMWLVESQGQEVRLTTSFAGIKKS